MHILSVLYRELGSYTILLHIPLALATSVRACVVVFFRRAPRRRVYAKQGRQTRPGAVTSKASKHWRCIRHSDLSGRPHHSLAARSRLVESDLTGMLPLRRDARARPIPRPACPGPQPYRPQRAVSELDVAAAKRTPAGRQPHRDRPETFFRSHYCPFYAARVYLHPSSEGPV